MDASITTLRILLVEDSEDDMELICNELAQGGFRIDCKRVETAAALQHALEQWRWDVVICDHNLPALDSTAALEIVQKAHEKMPFIIVSGMIPEEQGVASMFNGARDFIGKESLSRLVPVVRREMREVALRSDLGKAQEILYRLAHFDRLTGLPNREHLFQHLAAIMTDDGQDSPFAVFLIDLNRFRNITRSLGIQAGNKVLLDMAERLCAVFGEEGFIARYGADRFVAVVPYLVHESQAERVATMIHSSLDRAFITQVNELFITASIGMGFYPRDGRAPEDLMENVESALYGAKAPGGRGYQAYRAELGGDGKARLAMESSLYRALGKNEFLLHYQPQFDLRNKRMIGAEALIRWRHPESGLIPPDAFIPILEDTGLIVPVGEWILHTACAQNKQWQEAGLPPVRVAVNLSATQFQQPGLVGSVRAALQVSGLSPEYLELEITENIAVHNEESVIAVLGELRALGIRIAIDDFGTGYSSLSYLKRFPIDKLKIDQSFVRDYQPSAPDDGIIRAIIAMARSLNLKVIAEGVETLEQADFLRANGCDEVQGYFYGKPMPGGELAALMGRGAEVHPASMEALPGDMEETVSGID
ncbi:MAG TPA: GGDEF domain-containing response regulator [Gallionella sp.]|nr:GGDEF domain-containing response regulator [Gallionella sp.]